MRPVGAVVVTVSCAGVLASAVVVIPADALRPVTLSTGSACVEAAEEVLVMEVGCFAGNPVFHADLRVVSLPVSSKPGSSSVAPKGVMDCQVISLEPIKNLGSGRCHFGMKRYGKPLYGDAVRSLANRGMLRKCSSYAALPMDEPAATCRPLRPADWNWEMAAARCCSEAPSRA